MDNLDTFAPSVDIQAEMDKPAENKTEAKTEETPVESEIVRIDRDEPEESTDETTDETPPEKTEEKPVKTVPIHALHEARQKLKDSQAKFEQMERESAQKFADLQAQIERFTNPPPAVPSFEENPAEYLKHKVELTEQQQAAQQQQEDNRRENYQRQVQYEQTVHAITNEMTSAEAKFSKEHPDYQDAVKHLQKVVAQTLELSGVEAGKIQATALEQSRAMVYKALQDGKNPAEVAYTYAKAYGYSPKGDVASHLKRIAAGSSTTQTLGSSKGETQFSIAALAQMNDEEVTAAIADDKNWARIVKQG